MSIHPCPSSREAISFSSSSPTEGRSSPPYPLLPPDSIDFPLGRTDYSIDPFLRFPVPVSRPYRPSFDRDPLPPLRPQLYVTSRERGRRPPKKIHIPPPRRRSGCKFHGCRAACLLPLQVRSTPSGPRGSPSLLPSTFLHHDGGGGGVEMLLRGLGPARFKEAELIRVFAWKQRQGWPSVYRGLGRGGVGEGRGNLRRWCRAAATSRDTRLRSSWHEPSWHVFPLGLSLRPPFHALPRCTLAPQSAPILSLARSPSLLLLLLRLGLRYAHVDMYIYIYIIRAEQTSRSQNSFSTARGILFGTDDGIREGVGFVQPADRLSSIVRCKYGIVPESPANARKISFSSSRCVLLLAISFRIAIEESSNAVFLSNTREQIKSSRLIVRYSRYLLARNR